MPSNTRKRLDGFGTHLLIPLYFFGLDPSSLNVHGIVSIKASESGLQKYAILQP
jgi:hypothetical protein